MARGCARVGTRGLSFTSRGFAPMLADHSLGYESRICADARGSPAPVTRRGFAPMARGSPARSRGADSRGWYADHRLGHESRICARISDIADYAARSVTSRGFAPMHADHRLGHESRICADARGSPARSRVADLRRCTRITGSVTRRGFAPMHADHRLGHEARICADARGSPARSRGADLRRCTRITGSITSRGFAPMHADHRLGHEARMHADHPGREARMRADSRGSPARSRGADLRRWSRITGSVTRRGCARIAIGDSECRSESTLPLASLILQHPSRGSVAIPPYSRIGNRRKTNVLGWPDACDTWPA